MASFETHCQLGKGCYSIVYKARKKDGIDNGCFYALKVQSSVNRCNAAAINVSMEYLHAQYEYDCARKLHSPYTQQIQYVFKDSRGAYMASTLMIPFTKYWAAMRHDGAYFSEDQARFYIAELILPS